MYLVLLPTDESKGKLKKYEEIWSRIKDPIRSTNDNSIDYEETYMKIMLNSDNDFSLKKKKQKKHNNGIIKVARSDFNDGNKYYTIANTIHKFS